MSNFDYVQRDNYEATLLLVSSYAKQNSFVAQNFFYRATDFTDLRSVLVQ